jgi:hypothetical protein
LVLHDTTELSYRHEDTEPIGIVMKTQAGAPRPGRPRFHTRCGILMHSSLVITQSGQPLGLAAIKFWSRDKFHRANALKRKINPTRVPIEKKESIRWLENVRHHVDKERVRDLGTDWTLVGIGATTWARAVDRIQ